MRVEPLSAPPSVISRRKGYTLATPPYVVSVPDPLPKGYDFNARCEFHSGGTGHTTDKCYNLRHKIQDLIDQELLEFETGEDKPNVIQQRPPPRGSSNNTGPLINKISDKKLGFSPSQLITLPGSTKVQG